MSFIEAIVLGIVQGLTEFLPISSTAHLTLAGKLMNLVSTDHPEQWTSFIAIIQLGTLVSVLLYFWKDLWNIAGAMLQDNILKPKKFSEQEFNSKLGWYMVVGTIPVVIIGLAFKDIIEGSLTKNLYVIASSLIILAVILAVAEKTAKFRKEMKEITMKDAFIIGIAQSFALIPGASRSGTTITGGLFLGLKRDTAARFSFLLSIPAVFASGILELRVAMEYINSSMALNMIVAAIAAAVSGYLAIDFLIKFLKKHSTFLFIWYRIGIGLIILILLLTNLIQP